MNEAPGDCFPVCSDQSEGYSITESCSVCVYIYVCFFLRNKKSRKKISSGVDFGSGVRPYVRTSVRPSVRPASVRPKKKMAPKIFFKMQELWFFYALITSRIVVWPRKFKKI